jgi:hypothetical protein
MSGQVWAESDPFGGVSRLFKVNIDNWISISHEIHSTKDTILE